MNEDLVLIWNSTVNDHDTVFVLGDFAMNENRARDFGKLLNGEKHLVPGNHDKPFFSNKPKYVNKYNEGGFNIRQKQMEWILPGAIYVKLSHLPYADKSLEYDDRYLEERPIKGNEDFLIHGHLHAKYLRDGNRIDVAFDNNFKLYSEKDILRIIKGPQFQKSRLTDFYSKRQSKGEHKK